MQDDTLGDALLSFKHLPVQLASAPTFALFHAFAILLKHWAVSAKTLPTLDDLSGALVRPKERDALLNLGTFSMLGEVISFSCRTTSPSHIPPFGS